MKDWLHIPLPAMEKQGRFGDRVVPVFKDRPRSVWEMVAGAASINPGGEALVSGTQRLSWREVEQSARQVSAGLARLGVRRGDRVALLLGNRAEFVLAWFGAAHLGAVIVPLSTRQQKPEVAYALNDCGARMIIHEESLADRLPDPAEIPTIEHRIATGITAGSQPFSVLMGDVADAAAPGNEEDTALILYTSGTTGKPKGAMLAHCNIVHSALIYEACMMLTQADRSIAVVPLAHVTGIIANIASMARCAGALIIVPEFKAADYLRICAQEKATQTIMVPAMYNLCLLQADFVSYDLSAWRIGGFGGAPMPSATIERLAQHMPGLKLINAYGATETTSPTTIMPPELTAGKLDSVGLACPGVSIVVMDDAGRELPAGEVGELWIHGGSVIKGYWSNPAATAENFIGGYWRSGDLGSVDAEGFVRVFDRKKDMINRGGLKIYSAEVESVLAGHPDVLESAVISKPCPVLGERVHAVVVPRTDNPDAEALRAWCAARLSDYKVPETILFSAEPLPRNANGKVMKRNLRVG